MAGDVSHLWSVYLPRFLAEGLPHAELQTLQGRGATWADWISAWSDAGAAAEWRAAEARKSGFTCTAGVELSRAALHYCFGQFLLWHDPAAKQALYQRSAQAWRAAAPYLDPPQVPVEIPFRDVALPGYLRRPRGAQTPPAVILLGGLDSPKEEMQIISQLCVQRGLATLSFDGPGQGETFARIKLSHDLSDAVHAAVDFLQAQPEIDGTRIGIIGRSLGGYYAPRAAALDARIKAVVVWGAMYHLRNYRSLPPLTAAGFVYATGSRDLSDAAAYLEGINLDDVVDRIRCPLLIAHSGKDAVTPEENAILLRDRARGPVEFLFYPGSGHCFHDQAHIARAAMADFLWKHLVRGARDGDI